MEPSPGRGGERAGAGPWLWQGAPEGSGLPSTTGCSQEGPWQGTLSTTTPRGQVSASATPAWLALRASLFLLGWDTGAFGCSAPCSPPAEWGRLIPPKPLQDTRQGGTATRAAASPAGPRAGELGHSCDMGLRPTGRDTQRWAQLAHPGRNVLGSPRRACSSQWLPPEGTQESSGAFGQSCGAL